MVLCGPRQGDDESTGNLVREAVHVVDLVAEQKLADVREDRFGLDVTGRVLDAVDRRRDAAGIEALDGLDQLDHGVAQVCVAPHAQAVGLDHHRAGADQQVAEAGPRTDAGMAMVGRVGLGEELGVLGLATQEHAVPGNEDVLEHAHGSGLSVLATEQRLRLAGTAGRTRDHGQAGGVDRHCAGDREVAILGGHGAAG